VDPAAMADDDFTPTADEWTVDDALHHLTRVAKDRLPVDQAIYELLEALRAGRVPAIRKFFVDGVPANIIPIAASLWQHRLELIIVEGRLEVLQHPLGAVLGGSGITRASGVFLPPRTIREIWPPRQTGSPRQRLNTKTWLQAEFERRRAAGDIPSGHGAFTRFTEKLAERMAEAAKAGKVTRAIGARRIETVLNELKLWPIQ
jgi:hypothetical protein